MTKLSKWDKQLTKPANAQKEDMKLAEVLMMKSRKQKKQSAQQFKRHDADAAESFEVADKRQRCALLSYRIKGTERCALILCVKEDARKINS